MTGTVTLSRLTSEHAPAMYRWVSDPEVRSNIGLVREPSLEGTLEWIRRANSEPQFVARAILLEGAHVGNVVLDQIDRNLSAARLSIYVGEPTVRRHGVASAALRLMLSDAFGSLGLNRVYLTVHCGNLPALRAYLGVGFRVEGVLRDGFTMNGKRVDAYLMSVLATRT